MLSEIRTWPMSTMRFTKRRNSCLMLILLQISIAQQPLQTSAQEEVNPQAPNDDRKPIVHTQVGSFRGLQAQDGNYSMFLGIPYARVNPDNVFGPTIPPVFEETFDAFDDSAVCPQREEFNNTIIGTLDCLTINIYVPNSATTERPLPVMINIFGGKFQFGFASRYVYGPRFIVRHDIIFVTFNYRVGPYGFLCLDTPDMPGNMGLKDQVQALRWIKENIRSFGGDDSNITLAGISAGAMSVDLHQYYLEEPLYNRVIIQSGVAITPGLMDYADPKVPFKLAKMLNYTTNDMSDALLFLSKVDPFKLIAAYEDSGLIAMPCVEKYFGNAENYATKHPGTLNRVRGNVDVLIGFSNDEGYAGYTKMEKASFERLDVISDSLKMMFDFKGEQKLFHRLRDTATHFYYGDDVHCAENRRPAVNAYSDFTFYSPTLHTIKKYLGSGVENMYLYMFSYSGERSFIKDKDKVSYTDGGSSHADEIGYLFDISYMKTRMKATDMLIVDRMTELWTNFVKYGNPTPGPTELIPTKWPRVTQSKLSYLEINTELRLSSSPMHQRMSFIDLLYGTIELYQNCTYLGKLGQNTSILFPEENTAGVLPGNGPY